MLRTCLLLLLGLLAGGCSIPRSVAEGGAVASHHVSPTGRVLILAVPDGQEQGQSPAPGSGEGMTAALRKVLTQHDVPLSTTATSAAAAGMDEARRSGFDYALKCTMTLWEDNATAWSGNGDKLTISVELYDARSRELVAAATHRRVATGATFVASSPSRFMDEVALGALDKIYGWSDKKAVQAAPTLTQQPLADVETPKSAMDAMNVELRGLAKEALARGDQKAAKEYLDMIVPTAGQK